jgi:predicted nucleic acid-binding protein
VGVVVFDSDVLIGFLSAADAHHAAAVRWMQEALRPGTTRQLCAVNLSEILIGPLRAGTAARVNGMLTHLSIETISVDDSLARHAAEVRATTNLKLPDAYAVATALQAEQRDIDVRLATFDAAVLRTHGQLRRG